MTITIRTIIFSMIAMVALAIYSQGSTSQKITEAVPHHHHQIH